MTFFSARSTARRPLRLGIVSDEHLGVARDRKGGFAWATQQVAQLFRDHPEFGVRTEILHCARLHLGAERPAEIDGVPVRWRQDGRFGLFPRGGRGIDLLLSIDYQTTYRIAFIQWPRTPVIFWVRDPWDSNAHAELCGVRVPGQPDVQAQSTIPPNHRSMHQVWLLSRLLFRKLIFGSTADFLRARVPNAYAIPMPEIFRLPNPLAIDPAGIEKTPRPSVLFLARLFPVKRPWLFVELARAFPDADFFVAGHIHDEGPGGWQPGSLPPNIRLLGHVSGEAKRRLIASSWVLVNTSAHEGLPVSVQEALACGVPLLSTLDPDGTASRFGIFVGHHHGDGMAALPALSAGLARLLSDHAERERLGEAGRRWVTETHNPAAFLAAFRSLAARAGRPLPKLPRAPR